MMDAVNRDNTAKDLLEQTAEGSQPAFEELCRLYRAPLFRQALNLLGNPETAEEVVQDVFLAIWRGAKNFKGQAQPFSWMWAILRNQAIGALRRSIRAPQIAAVEWPEEATLSDPEMDATICQAIGRLTPEHRLTVILTYYLNLSQAQISRLMGCPVGTVKSRLSHALRQLRTVWAFS
jgi:RNA polymerase sigma-70 factor (ECF subfamily)